MDHLKLHILVVRKLGLICSFAITRAYRHDSPIFPRLMAALSIVEFILCGDAAYLSRLSCKMVSEKKGIAFFKIKKNVSAKKKGVKAWYEIVMLFKSMPWGYLLIYRLRVYVEAIFGAVKQRFDHQIYSRIWFMQRRELGLKVISHNVKQLLYIQEAKDSDIPL
ncbi:MAG: transposase [Thermoplasmata archaeon]